MRQWADLIRSLGSLLRALSGDIHLPGLGFEHSGDVSGRAAILWAPIWNRADVPRHPD